jgi:hypothetical protein
LKISRTGFVKKIFYYLANSMKETFKQLRVIHLMICASAVLFAAVSKFTDNGLPDSSETAETMKYIAVIICASAYMLGRIVFQWLRRQAFNQTEESLMAVKMRAAYLIHWAMMEFAILFCIVVYFIYREERVLYIVIGMLLILMLFRPRPEDFGPPKNLNN